MVYDNFKQQADCLIDGIDALLRRLLHVIDVALDVAVIHARQWLEWVFPVKNMYT